MPTRPRDRYDTPWKRALQRYLPDFMAFFFPAQWREIAHLRPRPLRDKEAARLGSGGRPHTLIADMLASAILHDGREVLLHIEVQSQRDPELASRILDYKQTLSKLHGLPVVSLVVLADAGKRWRAYFLQENILGMALGFCFPVARIADYADLVDELLVERNVFALVAAAHLLAQRTHGDPEARYAAKCRLLDLLYQRGWRKRRIIDLFVMVHWLLPLPDELELRMWRRIARFERRLKVIWLGPLEEIFLERGEKRGVKKGLKQGREEGRREGAALLLERQLASRFGPPSATTRKRLRRASVEQLAQWSEAVLDAQTLKQVFTPRP
ncbi:DUF4351 domain-containing protein [Pseudoduganella sp.]|uniref:DUF4351 domain-containing protein n=1 Tax=Pseudoduganella sp. TaxID=1880898 RepID=UPI0035B1B71A